MPPKKKKCAPTRGACARPKGAARLYLESNFSLPADIAESTTCQNGHVFLQYLENNKELAHAANIISEKFTFTPDVKKIYFLCKRATILMTNQSEENKKKFEDLCNEHFVRKPLASTSLQSAVECSPVLMAVDTAASEPSQSDILSTDSHTSLTPRSEPMLYKLSTDPGLSTASCSPQTVTVRLRSDDTTPRKQLLKRRLSFLSKTKSEMHEKYRHNLAKLKARIKTNPKQIKLLNQTIKRKETTIRNLREASKQKDTHSDLNTLNKEKILLKQKNRVKMNQIRDKIRAEFEGKLRKKDALIRKKDKQIRYLETLVDQFQEKVMESKPVGKLQQPGAGKKDKKTYSTDIRMMVYDCIVNQTPTRNIPTLLQKIAKRLDSEVEVPCRTLVKQMTRELGVTSDLCAAKFAMTKPNITLGFDATTQEGMHINCVHLTSTPVTTDANDSFIAGDQQPGEAAQISSSDISIINFINQLNCCVIAINELPGGTANDYQSDIMQCVDHLAAVFSDFYKTDLEETRSKMIANISNTMSDRAAVNHATVQKVNESWGKSLNELNCHLHPLDSAARECKKALKSVETERGQVLGKECLAANIVVAVNKLRFRDAKGDPRGFENFLDENHLPKGLIPRYVGNRLHVLFLTCSLFVKHHALLLKFFSTSPVTCGRLTDSLAADFSNETAKKELCVLGLLGKKLTGPWMKKFYVPAESKLTHIQGIDEVKKVITCLEEARDSPLSVLTTKSDFFGNSINDDVFDAIVSFCPHDSVLMKMISVCIAAVLNVLNRQYARYLELDITEDLRRQTASARLHNMDAEAVMGMISAEKHRSPNVTVCFLSSKMRAIKNKTVACLDSFGPEEREKVVQWAVKRARNRRGENKAKYVEMKQEISKRQSHKRQQKEEKNRKRVESQLQQMSANNVPLAELFNSFQDLNPKARSDLSDVWEDRVVGRIISHWWYDKDGNIRDLYSGRIEKQKKKRKTEYVVAYWKQGQAFDEGDSYDVSKFALAADIILGDLILTY